MLSTLATIVPYLQRYRRYLIWGLLAVAAHNVLRLVTPMVLRQAVDHLREGLSTSAIWSYAGLVVGLAVAAGVFLFLMRRTVIWASRKMEFDLRGDLFAHLLTLSPSYYDRTPTGEILSRASTDVDAVRMMLGPGIMYSANALIVGLGAVPFMFYLDWQLALFTLVPLPILSLTVNRLGAVVHRRFMAIQKHFAVISAHAQESLAGIRVVKSGSRESVRHQEFTRLNDTYFSLNMKLIRTQGLFHPLLYFLAGCAVVVVLYFGGNSVIAGRISLGSFVAYTLYLAMLIWPMIALGWVVSMYQRGTASLKRINEILAARSDILDQQVQPVDHEIAGALAFNHLTFAYPGSTRPILQDFSLHIPAGQTLALLGATGSGKTTLLRLLTRAYPVPEGAVTLDGRDLNHIPLVRLREIFGVAAQEPFLFSTTIADNIGFGLEQTPSPRKLTALADTAGILGEIKELPAQWQTIIGERGITLSGGQKQRISLARALAIGPKILLLDDAFSSVDTQTEEHILDHLAEHLRGRTVLMVSHRVSTARRADRIAVIDQGGIAEVGTHEELLARGGLYATLVEKQTLREQLEAI
jgi:ATP-binding cassette subfamily B protein